MRPDLVVPRRPSLNPPLWELGHIGWFQEYWIARNPQRDRGAAADADAARLPGLRAQSDALYDSSRVAHAHRWELPLPDAEATRDDLQRQLEQTLSLLAGIADRTDGAVDDAALYFFRLALFHEDMHHEAALYMAQHLGIPVTDPRWQPRPLDQRRTDLALPAGCFVPGADVGQHGFAFDNELGAQPVTMPAGAIDSRVLDWSEYLPFVEACGYMDASFWTREGRQWLANAGVDAPRYLRSERGQWQCWRGGQWQPLDLSLPACHLTLHEAQAWCRWAGRRLPTEMEWEHAARTGDPNFRWGDVWEWTDSAFAPYPGFVPHPYRDYSAPWFGTRQVLRGASFLTQPRLRDARYRNFFPAERNDVPAGFRTLPGP